MKIEDYEILTKIDSYWDMDFLKAVVNHEFFDAKLFNELILLSKLCSDNSIHSLDRRWDFRWPDNIEKSQRGRWVSADYVGNPWQSAVNIPNFGVRFTISSALTPIARKIFGDSKLNANVLALGDRVSKIACEFYL